MRRQHMKHRVDSAIFKRTARSTAKANLTSTSYRGGIRL